MGQHIEEIALLGVDDPLHRGELVSAEPRYFRNSSQEVCSV